MSECSICIEPFNKTKRSKVNCPYCLYDVCTTCTEKYLCETPDDAHCMSCRKAWSREILTNNFSQKFISKTYKERRENLLLEREKSLMPETQPYVEIEKKIRKITNDIAQLDFSMNSLNDRISQMHGRSIYLFMVEHSIPDEFEATVHRHKLVTELQKEFSNLSLERRHLDWVQGRLT